MRLFFAVLLPEEAREAVARVQSELRAELGDDGIRWVKPELLHYTLIFLGETPEERLPFAREAARLTAEQVDSFSLTVAHIDGLPASNFPQTLYAYVDVSNTDSCARMKTLAQTLKDNLISQQYTLKPGGFLPHLTLARIKSSQGSRIVRNWMRTHTDPSSTSHERRKHSSGQFIKVDKITVFVVESFALVQSELRPEGPTYTVLETFPLQRPQPRQKATA